MVKTETVWKKSPLKQEILMHLLSKENRGEMLVDDLYRTIKRIYPDIKITNLMRVLFELEVRSYIHVIKIKKNQSKVEINRYGNFSDDISAKLKKYSY